MGVGGTAGELGYGERGIVESTAITPTPNAAMPTGPAPARTQTAPGVSPAAAAANPFGPTSMPRQPINAGLDPQGVPINDPVQVLRNLYRRFPYPEIRRLIERRDAMQEGPASHSMNTFGGYMDMANSPQGDSWMRQDGMRQRVMDNTMDRIRRERPSQYFPSGEEDPDQSQMTPEQQAQAEQTMNDIRRNRTGGRFAGQD